MLRYMNNITDKKNIKIIIAALVAIIVIVGIVLGITIRPSSIVDNTAKVTANTTADANSDGDGMQQGGGGDADEMSQLEQIATYGDAAGQGAPVGVGNANGEASGQSAQGSSFGANGSSSNGSTGGNGAPSSNANPNYADGSTSNVPVSIPCTITIDCSSISGNGALTAAGNPQLEPYAANPYILAPTTITVSDTNGDGRVGVDEAIKQACNTYGIQYEFKGSNYLRGMNYLYEFNAGPNSGWMYKVNGKIPNKGCNTYYLNGYEDILWYYVISY